MRRTARSGAGQPAADRGACWKFNLECHSFGGGPSACHRLHANMRLSAPPSHDLPCGRVTAATSNRLFLSFMIALIRLSYFQMGLGFPFIARSIFTAPPQPSMPSSFVAYLCFVRGALRKGAPLGRVKDEQTERGECYELVSLTQRAAYVPCVDCSMNQE